MIYAVYNIELDLVETAIGSTLAPGVYYKGYNIAHSKMFTFIVLGLL